MKRIVSLLLAFALLLSLAACGNSEPAATDVPTYPTETLALTAAAAGGGDVSALQRLQDQTDAAGLEAYLADYYGIPREDWVEVGCWRLGGAEAFETAVILLKDEDAAERAKSGLEAFQFSREGDFTGYFPDQAEMVSNSIVLTYQNYAALLICPDPDAAETALLDILHGDAVPTVTAPAALPSASTPVPGTAVPTEEPAIDTPLPDVPTATSTVEPAPSTEPSAEPAASPAQEETAAPTAKPTAEPTPAPTDMPVPTDTPAPTAEPIPTETPEPTPEATTAPTAEPIPEQTPEVPATPTAEPTPEPTSTPAPTPTPAPDPTPEPTPGRTYPVFYPGRTPYTPPTDEDMTIYDTSAILAAWRAKDPSGLSEYDRTIYDKAKAVLDTELHEGMDCYEIEWALYHWVIVSMHYDQDHEDPLATVSRDSYTPYGGLVNHKGVCLGFASLFQLLMDMAGQKCITVVGAAYSGNESHAWNMVNLEGRWYCVDSTWDWTNYTENHIGTFYFNVSSDLMAVDHQWDYSAVPEAKRSLPQKYYPSV